GRGCAKIPTWFAASLLLRAGTSRAPKSRPSAVPITNRRYSRLPVGATWGSRAKVVWAGLITWCTLHSVAAAGLLLKGATVHTISGDTLSPGQILIEAGKITAVGKEFSPGNAQSIDLTGQHLYPGLILLDSVLGLTEIEAVRATDDASEVGDYTPDV